MRKKLMLAFDDDICTEVMNRFAGSASGEITYQSFCEMVMGSKTSDSSRSSTLTPPPPLLCSVQPTYLHVDLTSATGLSSSAAVEAERIPDKALQRLMRESARPICKALQVRDDASAALLGHHGVCSS
jgi:hypothetical protein